MIVEIKTNDLHNPERVRGILSANGLNFKIVDSYSQGVINSAFETIGKVNYLPFPVSFVKECAYYEDIEDSILENAYQVAKNYTTRINNLYTL